MKESKRFYGLFRRYRKPVFNFSGQVVRFCSEDIKQFYATHEEAWQVSLYLLMGAVVVFGFVAMVLYRWYV